MATWDGETPYQGRVLTAQAPVAMRQMSQLLAAGLVLLMMTSGPYYVLRLALSQTPLATAGRSDAPQVSSSARSGEALVVKTAQAPTAILQPVAKFVVSFGRFHRQDSAEAQARRVRSKGYVAKVVQSGATYVVVSRPYRSLSDAHFWSKVFGEIGLEARALARLEARRQGLSSAL